MTETDYRWTPVADGGAPMEALSVQGAVVARIHGAEDGTWSVELGRDFTYLRTWTHISPSREDARDLAVEWYLQHRTRILDELILRESASPKP